MEIEGATMPSASTPSAGAPRVDVDVDVDVDGPVGEDPGVTGNSRLTGLVAAVLLVALAVEGITLWDVRQMLTVHAFIGLLVVPPVVVKLASTGYRMVRYYLRDDRFRRRGPPHWILRVLGPVVVVSTVSLLGTGVALLVVGPHRNDWLGFAHRASFVIWFAVMVVHVLGHLLETARLWAADWRPASHPRVRGARVRTGVVALSLVIGVGLGLWSTQWGSGWRKDFRGGAQQAHRPKSDR